MAKIPSLKNLWRSWLRNESPRRWVLQWSITEKIGLIIISLTVSILASFQWLQVPDITSGMIASKDEIAPKNAFVKYREAQDQKGSELMKSKIFVQVIDKKQSKVLEEKLNRNIKELELVSKSKEVDRIGPINLLENEQKWLNNINQKKRETWEEEIKIAAKRMLSQGLINTLGFEQLEQASSIQLNQLGERSSPARSIGSKLLARTFYQSTNLRRDSSLQILLEDTITRERKTIQVNSGDLITKKGEKISPQAYAVLEHFSLVKKSPRFIPFIKTFLEAFAGCLVLLLIMKRERPCLQAKHGLLGLLLIIALQIGQLSKIWLGSAVSPLAVFVPATLLSSQSFGSASALAWLAIANLLWLTPIQEIGEGRMIIAFLVSALVAFQGSQMRSRAQLLQMAFLLPFGALLSEWFFLRGGMPNTSDDLVYEAVAMGGMLMIAILLIPILETTFGLITRARLLELADQERPLIRRLSSEAPGTFEHTLLICGLAEEGARIIGADVDLIKTGALYHDIGKLHAPEWFIENQNNGVNPHEKLNDPLVSAGILQAHVDEGIKLAKRYRLPRPIADFIPEHQGTLKMGYFLHRAKEKNIIFTEKDFRYKGPIPRSRETAILMLADGCEAALRSLSTKSAEKEASLTVRKMVKSRQEDGQLKESSLTNSEIELIINAFVNVWKRMRHRRIPYPIASRK